MSRTDLISDIFTIIRNATFIKIPVVDVPASTLMKAIVEILKKENYIENSKFIDDKRQGILRIYLKYIDNKSVIHGIKRVSKPSLRVYVKKDKVPIVLRRKGMAFISTSQGILTDKEAREKKLGGEVIGYVW